MKEKLIKNSILIGLIVLLVFVLGCERKTSRPEQKTETRYTLREVLNAIALYNQITESYKRNQYARTIELSQQFLDRYPHDKNCAQVQYYIGKANFKTGNYKVAKEELQKVIHRYPDTQQAALAQLNIGGCYARQHKYDQSIQECQKVIDNYPDANEETKAAAFILIATVYAKQQKYDQAIQKYQKIIDKYPKTKSSQIARKRIAQFQSQK